MPPVNPINPPFSVAIGCLVASHASAFITTVLRLLYRLLVSRLWWDDFWAFVALFADTLVWAVYASAPIKVVEKPLAFQIFWKMSMIEGGSLAVWASRLSIAVTIVRLAPPGPFNRICKGASYMFGLLYLVVAIEKIFCAGVKWDQIPYCALPKYTNLTILISDLVSDVWLLAAPAYMMMRMKVSQRHRRLIIAIFSCEIFVTFSSIVCAYFNLKEEPYLAGISAHIQLGVSIVVCNLLVLVTYVYRIFTSHDDSSSTTSISSSDSPPQRRKTAHFLDFRTRQLSLQLTDLGSSFGPPSDSGRSTSPNAARTTEQSPASTAADHNHTRLTTTFDLTDFSSHFDSLGLTQPSAIPTTTEMTYNSSRGASPHC